MIRIWREPEVAVRFGGCSIVQSASDTFTESLDEVVRLDPPGDLRSLFGRPQMNGYNVHDGVLEDGPAAER